VKIVSLKSENIKRLRAVEIHPNGQNVVVIGGRNAQGKSSVLDAIEYALGGKPKVERPLRDGATKGYIVLETEELRITRNFTAKGSTLVVEDLKGGKHSSPQATLDKLYNALSFDPLAFSRQPAREQAEALKALVGIDLTPLDNDRKQAFDERTLVNREVKSLEAQLSAMPAETIEPVSVAELTAELEAGMSAINNLRQMQDDRNASLQECNRFTAQVKDIDEQILALQKQRAKLVSAAVAAREKAESILRDLEALGDAPDLSGIRTRIHDAESINARAAQSQKRRELETHLAGKRDESANLTAKIDAIDEEKRLSLAEAKFPVNGLAFDENGVTFNGVPFAQCSSAEQLRVSVAIGLAMNKELNVMLIREGSLLDQDSMAVIAEMAESAKAQFWIEVVSNDGAGCTVVIEDGMVAV